MGRASAALVRSKTLEEAVDALSGLSARAMDVLVTPDRGNTPAILARVPKDRAPFAALVLVTGKWASQPASCLVKYEDMFLLAAGDEDAKASIQKAIRSNLCMRHPSSNRHGHSSELQARKEWSADYERARLHGLKDAIYRSFTHEKSWVDVEYPEALKAYMDEWAPHKSIDDYSESVQEVYMPQLFKRVDAIFRRTDAYFASVKRFTAVKSWALARVAGRDADTVSKVHALLEKYSDANRVAVIVPRLEALLGHM